MTTRTVHVDERTHAVENAAFRWGYLLVAYGLLGSVAWRAFERGEASWDLLALLVGSGLLMTVLRARQRAIGWQSIALTAAAAAIAAVVPLAMALFLAGRG